MHPSLPWVGSPLYVGYQTHICYTPLVDLSHGAGRPVVVTTLAGDDGRQTTKGQQATQVQNTDGGFTCAPKYHQNHQAVDLENTLDLFHFNFPQAAPGLFRSVLSKSTGA